MKEGGSVPFALDVSMNGLLWMGSYTTGPAKGQVKEAF